MPRRIMLVLAVLALPLYLTTVRFGPDPAASPADTAAQPSLSDSQPATRAATDAVARLAGARAFLARTRDDAGGGRTLAVASTDGRSR